MIKYIQGDLFDFVEPGVIIPHVCNNANKWGRGFVVPLMEHYLKARIEFDKWAKDGWDGQQPYKLGFTQIVEVEPQVIVANMIAQVFYVRDGSIRQTRPLYYNKLVSCMEHVGEVARVNNLRILAPKFGSELAGGDWKFVECLIDDIWNNLDVTIVEYK